VTSRWLTEAIVTARIDRVTANVGAAGERITDARRHIASARSLADSDTTLALSACHDAIRKAITGHMVANGVRPKSGDGAHRIVLEYCRHELAAVISSEDVDSADSIRRDRATAEYGDFGARQITSKQVLWAAEIADRVVNAIATSLATNTPRKRRP
jgi:hypothetical protein